MGTAMNEPTTLGEYVCWMEEDGNEMPTLRRILYGTGRAKKPGLVERVAEYAYSSNPPMSYIDALRSEIGGVAP